MRFQRNRGESAVVIRGTIKLWHPHKLKYCGANLFAVQESAKPSTHWMCV
jgi:hypothetical protein